MSRGGGSFGKRSKPQVKIRTEEEEAKENPLLIQNKNVTETPPETYPPLANPAKKIILSAQEKDIVERARVLHEFFRYSGYHLKRPSTNITTSVTLEKYSDRYRKIEGKRDLADEMPNPSTHQYPRELLIGTRHRSSAKSQFESKVQYRSSHDLKAAAERLVNGSAGDDEMLDDLPLADSDDVRQKLDDALRQEGSGRGDDDDEKDEEEEEQDEAEEEEDEMGGGDYTENYDDDDEDGDRDAFGDDGGDGDTY